tara:strand:+ start:2981 stop:4084 length:1104 start_codon:yes stop_codon:yes gene_type:complete
MSINQNKYSKQSYFMNLALIQAKKILGNTSKNPAVGCVVVKNNCLISAAHTSLNGRPHAEKNAIDISGRNIKNSELYVTLEPCSHYGKTSPCVKAIIKKKIKKVFFSIKDPDIRSYNKSTKKFLKNNIITKNGIFSNEIKKFYKSYFKYKSKELPFVTAKMAISKDFYSVSKNEKWITNNFSRSRVHLMRSNHDCILTSSKTIIEDNPRLTCRIKGLENTSPARIILDKKLKIPIKSNIISTAKKLRTIIFFNSANKRKISYLKSKKITVIKTDLNPSNNLDLKKVLQKIKKIGYSRIFLESGLTLTASFLNEGLVDIMELFVSNKNIGKKGKKNFKKYINLYLKNKKSYQAKVNLFGDRLISYRMN